MSQLIPPSGKEGAVTLQQQWKPSNLEISALKEKLLYPSEDEAKSLDFGETLKKSMLERHPFSNLAIGEQTFDNGLNDVLFSACSLGDLNLVRYFLDHHQQHFDINACLYYLSETETELEDRLFHLSIMSRVYCPDVFTARPTCKRQWYTATLLHVAVMKKHAHVASALLSSGASVNSTDCCFNTPLLQIVEMHPGEVPLIKDLIKCGADLNCQGGNSMTALMLVAKSRSDDAPQLVPLLLDGGADPSIVDGRGYTALHIAATEGNVEVVKLLLHHGVDPQFSEHGAGCPILSPLHLADQGVIFRLMTAQVQALFDRTSELVYHEILSEVLDLGVHSEDFDTALSGVSKLFSTHPECPASIKSIVPAIETTFLAITCSLDTRSNVFSHLKDSGTIEEFTFSQPLLEAYTRKGSFRIQTLADLVNVVTSKPTTSLIDITVCRLLLAEHFLGYGQEGVIHLILKVSKAMLFEWSSSSSDCSDFENGVLLLHRASEMLLFLISHSEGRMVARGASVFMLLIHLVSIIAHLVDKSLHQVLPVWSEPVSLTLGNASVCLGLYSQFLSSTHFHLVPDWDLHTVSHGLLQSLCRWLAVDRENGVLDAVKRLVGACLIITDSEGKLTTLLHLAIGMWREGKKRRELIQAMLDAGADKVINFLDYNGYRPLHSAALSSTKGLLDLLLDHGAHIDACDVSGNSIAKYCTGSAHPRLASLFDSPLPLVCLTSRAILHCGIDYMSLDLPARIKTMISYHDQTARNIAQ